MRTETVDLMGQEDVWVLSFSGAEGWFSDPINVAEVQMKNEMIVVVYAAMGFYAGEHTSIKFPLHDEIEFEQLADLIGMVYAQQCRG